ncbi:putative membrane protein [Moritella sp. JT01]|uniref:hypothetical protein n=1 Tax=Moritella sp. JT01 TaxID=756698 RepID=UPI00079278E2|nr:hypothetical protein [Moritella sp. JT01]KXO09273.1 putative membrane protein [Moritella sp. JT01]
MTVLKMKTKLWLGFYLFIIGIIAVGIHIQMTKAGVSYPQWEPPEWGPLALFVLQNIGILWLSKRVKEWRISPSFIKQWSVVFITMAALQELFIRLPLTAGYTVDQQYLFLWVYSYLPELLITLMITGGIVVISRGSALNGKVISILLVIIFSVLAFFFALPTLKEIIQPLMPYLTSPDSAGVLEVPYPWQVDVIASVTFIEPVMASFFICYLIYLNRYSGFNKLILQTIIALMVLTQSGAKFVLYLYYSSIESYIDRILSISQFTLEWVFIGVAVSSAIVYLTRKQRSGTKYPVS